MSASGVRPSSWAPGAIVPRKRALFGLLDADGWAWAAVKAGVWLVIIILMLGYIPDRAYYLDRQPDGRARRPGLVADQLLRARQRDPALSGAGRGRRALARLAAPSWPCRRRARTVASSRSARSLLYVGGSDGTTAQSTVYVAPTVGVGNFDKWTEGPALPEPRSDASIIAVSGIVYVIGGLDADGAPTTTVFRLAPDPQTGDLGDWEVGRGAGPARGPRGRRGRVHARRPPADRRRGAGSGRSPRRGRARFDTHGALGRLGAGGAARARRRPTATPRASATTCGCGAGTTRTDRSAPSSVGDLGLEAAEGLPENPDEGKVVQWATNDSVEPAGRARRCGRLVGQRHAVRGRRRRARRARSARPTGPSRTPTATSSSGSTSSSPTCPTGLERRRGGRDRPQRDHRRWRDGRGPVVATSVRANTAPQSPFFQLGLVGATVPGLKIEGEIGQQLGYLNAAGAGTVDFVILLLIGWAFAHKEQARGIVALRVGRRRRASASGRLAQRSPPQVASRPARDSAAPRD